MCKVLLSLAIGSMALLGSTPAGAQGTVVTPQRGQQGAGQGMGRGAAQGMGQGMGRGAGQPQRGQGLGQYQGDMFTLVHDPAVQRELQLDSEQLDRLRALGDSEHARQAAQMLSERGSCERTDDRRAVMVRVRQDIEDILDENQWLRLNQIWLQVRGVRALQSERVAKTLQLSPQQQGAIVRLLGGGFRGGAAQIEARALALLTDQQRQQFAAMQGPVFRQVRTGGGAGEPPRDGRGRGLQ
jgi:hypothetical protein